MIKTWMALWVCACELRLYEKKIFIAITADKKRKKKRQRVHHLSSNSKYSD